jgi:hypothetical protein
MHHPAKILIEDAALDPPGVQPSADELRGVAAVKPIAGVVAGRQLRRVVEPIGREREPPSERAEPGH